MDTHEISIAFHRRRYARLIEEYRTHWGRADFRTSMRISVLAFSLSLVAISYASNYANSRASNAVTDIVLSNIPVVDVSDWFVYGTFALIIFTCLLFFDHPKRMPFMLFTLAVFYFVRALFVSLTHLGPFPLQTINDFGTIITKLFFGGDYFFSGHTGTPFLLALIFWRTPWIRNVYLAWTLFFSIIVLLGHLHYSIDVLSALFVSYAVADIARWLFPKDHSLFMSAD